MLLLGGLLLAFGLRLYRLGGESLWYDETVSAYLARLPIPDLIAHTAIDIHPPGYYIVLHLWQALARPSLDHGYEPILAWPSLWFGVLTVALVGALGHKISGRPTGALALWLAALHPFQIMYAQEVRMYTLGTTLAVLMVWAGIAYLQKSARHSGGTHSATDWRILAVFVIVSAAGLYTLYYLLFLLLALALAITVGLVRQRDHPFTARRLAAWSIAQTLILLLWLPWLPTFLRQALDPPVPAWRPDWSNTGQITSALVEAFAALLVGQSAPGAVAWPWAGLGAVLLGAFFVYTKSHARTPSSCAVLTWALLGPMALIFFLSLSVTPLYHVRYVVIYAPVFLVISAFLLTRLARRAPLLSLLLVGLLVAGSLAALQSFHTDPLLRADDLRTAVRDLARAWRPGDVILANAGWVYPALAVYWPDEPASPRDAAPPPIAGLPRLAAWAAPHPPASYPTPRPWPPVYVVVGGSVDGAPSLGWSHPQSDFYAISTDDTQLALGALAGSFQRIWHFRLYDTVSDPAGVVRHELERYGVPMVQQTYPGPGFLLVEGISTQGASPPYPLEVVHQVRFGDRLVLNAHRSAGAVAAGSSLFVELETEAVSLSGPPTPLAASLRLRDRAGALAAQADTALPDVITQVPAVTTIAVPVPMATVPGQYALELVVYRPSDLAPLTVHAAGPASGEAFLHLGEVTITLPAAPSAFTGRAGRFDYLELLDIRGPAEVSPDAAYNLDLIWRPRPSTYRDNYTLAVELEAASGRRYQITEAPIGGPSYPSAQWPAGYPVRQLVPLALPTDFPPGAYSLHLSVRRTSDQRSIPAQSDWWPSPSPTLEVGQFLVRRSASIALPR